MLKLINLPFPQGYGLIRQIGNPTNKHLHKLKNIKESINFLMTSVMGCFINFVFIAIQIVNELIELVLMKF